MAKKAEEVVAENAIIEEKEWIEYKREISKIVGMFGSLIFFPFIVVVGIGFGVREGLIAALKKTAQMFIAWRA